MKNFVFQNKKFSETNDLILYFCMSPSSGVLEDSWIGRLASACSFLHSHSSGSLLKTPMHTEEEVRMKKAKNDLVWE